ncbi:MAG: MBL fold metallo-hydrolase [Rugosibacter sp.]|nr:MBL fold metallo-hydrolase [Rugosibacter sp.]
MNAPLTYTHDTAPDAGTAISILPGIEWICMPLPFALNHINLWLLADGGDHPAKGFATIDTGIATPDVRNAWQKILAGRTLTRSIVTHLHPDHVGNARWLEEKTGAALWMSQGDYLTAKLINAGASPFSTPDLISFFMQHGMGQDHADAFEKRGNAYKNGVPDLPGSYIQLLDNDVLRIGAHDWRTIVGYGHAAEHMSLYCEDLHVLISGDMLLPRISTNISVHPANPYANPLKLFLDSIDKFLALPADTLVLPSHGRPFRGLHGRVAALHQHHAERCEILLKTCHGQARSAAEIIPALFEREFNDAHQTMFAMGEAIAHLNYLVHGGKMRRIDSHHPDYAPQTIRFIS